MKIKLLANGQHIHIFRNERIHPIFDFVNNYPNTEKVVYVNIVNIFILEIHWIFQRKTYFISFIMKRKGLTHFTARNSCFMLGTCFQFAQHRH